MVEEFYGTRYHSGSFSLIIVGSVFYYPRSLSFFPFSEGSRCFLKDVAEIVVLFLCSAQLVLGSRSRSLVLGSRF